MYIGLRILYEWSIILCEWRRHFVSDADGRTKEDSSVSLSRHNGGSQTDRLFHRLFFYVFTSPAGRYILLQLVGDHLCG